MSVDLLHDRKALTGLIRQQVRDNIDAARKDIGRIARAQDSLLWRLSSPLRSLDQVKQTGRWEFPPRENRCEHIERGLAEIGVERLHSIEELRQAVERSGHLRRQAAYALGQMRDSHSWNLFGPLRLIHGAVGKTRESVPQQAALPSGSQGALPGKAGESGRSARDFLIWIYQDFLKPVTLPIVTVSGWCFCKDASAGELRMRCLIGGREFSGEANLRTDHVLESYREHPQSLHAGFDFYGIVLLPEDEEIVIEVAAGTDPWTEVLRLPVNNQIQTVSHPPIEVERADPSSFAVYFSEAGNYFYREMALYTARAIEQLGCRATVRSSAKPFDPSSKWHLIVSPNEFFFLGHFPRELAETSDKNILFLLADQPHTTWFKRSLSIANLATHILDISHDTIPLLKDKGLNATYLPLGYLERFPLYEGEGPLPLSPETESLGRAVREFQSIGRPLADRPIDISFVGTLTPRRDRFFGDNAARFWQYRCHFRLVGPYHVPVPRHQDPNMETVLTAGIARRSRVVLNIHRDESPYFEWHRMVLGAMWQEALVITEKSTAAPPFVPGVDYVEVDCDAIPDALDYYLKDPIGRDEAEAIRSSASRKLRGECRVVESLGRALRELGAPVTIPSLGVSL